jgi:N utilization substance protein B
MLYQSDANPDIDAQAVRDMIRDQLHDESLVRFGWELYAGVMEHRSLLDSQIASVAENWSLGRMPPTDRNVLRIGVYELLMTETPHRVVIDESIELAKKFGTAQSAQFVNGILDRLVPEGKREDDVTGESAVGE